MKKIIGYRQAFNLALWILLISGMVFTIGFGTCLYIAREEVTSEANKKVKSDINYVHAFIDGQLQRVEDAAYSLAVRYFGHTIRKEDGTTSVDIDEKTFIRPEPEDWYTIMQQFMDANPIICGIAFGFEPGIYPEVKCQYGFTPYVNRLSGSYYRMDLGEITDSRTWEWYSEAIKDSKGYWCNPFRDSSCGHVITCYNIPLHGHDGRLIGVMAVDVDTEKFGHKCAEVLPYPNAQVTLTDRNFNFICHPDTSYLLHNVLDIEQQNFFGDDDSMKFKMKNGLGGYYSINKGTDKEALVFFSPIERAGWTIAIQCPKSDIYGGIEKMKLHTSLIATISIIIMIICLVWIFRRLQAVTHSKAGIERDLSIASSIQMGMIPKLYPAFPHRPELDICGFIKPAKTVGGDLYDYFIKDDKFFFCIGDVSGKGVPASLFMATIRALFRNVSLHVNNPTEITAALNTGLAEGNDMNMFCTMFLGVLDLRTGHMDYCNAGHNAPAIHRLNDDGSLSISYMTPKTNLPLGVMEGFPFVGEETELRPGESIFLFTDGITEAENVEKELFGDEATLDALRSVRADKECSTAQDMVNAIYSKIELYATGTEQSDDITMLMIDYKG